MQRLLPHFKPHLEAIVENALESTAVDQNVLSLVDGPHRYWTRESGHEVVASDIVLQHL